MSQIKIHDLETGQIIEREMTKQELIDLQNEAYLLEQEEKNALELKLKKNALLEKLGITEDEAKLLLS